jgi:hypothetical protein
MAHSIHRRRFMKLTGMGLGVAAAGCSLGWWVALPASTPQSRTPTGDMLETLPLGTLPSFTRQGGPKVQEIYRYAVEHGDTLQYIPCFCGCGNIGHHHNGECYVAARLPNGSITFTSHGAM